MYELHDENCRELGIWHVEDLKFQPSAEEAENYISNEIFMNIFTLFKFSDILSCSSCKPTY